ncbi:MAG TPA: ribbon-helix-helix domain-containing protein [Actinomycetota bacterium]|nr:ribbon-helix-helix domain-containing protein [Actinomycetota bacterium]
MAQLVTRISDKLAGEVDALVAAGEVRSRSEAVRLGLEHLVDHFRRARIGAALVEGYRRMPQTEEELAWTDQATVAMINEESW